MKLYGFANSRSFRTLWLLEEVGAQYELKMLSPPDFNSDWFLEINPQLTFEKVTWNDEQKLSPVQQE